MRCTNGSQLFRSRRFQTLLVFHWIFNVAVLPEASENREEKNPNSDSLAEGGWWFRKFLFTMFQSMTLMSATDVRHVLVVAVDGSLEVMVGGTSPDHSIYQGLSTSKMTLRNDPFKSHVREYTVEPLLKQILTSLLCWGQQGPRCWVGKQHPS